MADADERPEIERPGRRRTGLGEAWGGPRESAGARPPLGRVAAWAYGVLGFVLLGSATVGAVFEGRGEGWNGVAVTLPIALYCAGLAWGACRLRSRSARTPASPWICAPLLLHALAGYLVPAVAVAGASGVSSRSLAEVASGAAMGGMLLGWVCALPAFFRARRAGALFVAAFLGPPALFLAMSLYHPVLTW